MAEKVREVKRLGRVPVRIVKQDGVSVHDMEVIQEKYLTPRYNLSYRAVIKMGCSVDFLVPCVRDKDGSFTLQI